MRPQVPRPFNNTQKVIMLARQRISFDPETVSLLRKTLDDAWNQLGPAQRAMTSRTLLAEHILKSAAKGSGQDILRRECPLPTQSGQRGAVKLLGTIQAFLRGASAIDIVL